MWSEEQEELGEEEQEDQFSASFHFRCSRVAFFYLLYDLFRFLPSFFLSIHYVFVLHILERELRRGRGQEDIEIHRSGRVEPS